MKQVVAKSFFLDAVKLEDLLSFLKKYALGFKASQWVSSGIVRNH